MMTLKVRAQDAAQEQDPKLYKEKQLLLRPATAMGQGSIDEQLVRLMVWVGAVLRSTTEHSREKDPLKILESGLAWCDQQVRVFMHLATKLLDCLCRDIAIYHNDGKNGHTVCEVRYDNAWHLFDVHSDHQAVYRDHDGIIMSHLLVTQRPKIVEAEQHWWKGNNGQGKVGFYQGDRREAMICEIYSCPK